MIESFGTKGIVDLKAGVVKGRGTQIDLETGEIGIHSTPIISGDIAIVGSAMREGATVETHDNTKGLVRAYDVRTGQAAVAVRHHSSARIVRQRHLAERIVGDQRQRRRLDADHRRRRARPRLPAGRNAIVGLLRRPSPGEQPLCRESRLRGSQDRPAQVAFPVRAPSDLELRHVVGAAAGRRDHRRQAAQSRRRAQQAGMAVCVRSRHRAAGVAD